MNIKFSDYDSIFSNNTVEECKEIQKKIEYYINKKKQEIHLVVKDNYYNLMNVANSIIKMETNFKIINEQFTKNINSFGEEKSHKSLINTNINFETPIDKNKLVYLHITKSLLYFPQLIRKLISASEYLSASILLYKIDSLNDQFKEIKNSSIFLNNIKIIESKKFLIKMIETEICNIVPEQNTHKIFSYLSSLNIIYKKTSLDIEKIFWEIRLKDISDVSFKINTGSNIFHVMLKKIIYTAIIGQYIFPEKFKDFMEIELKIDNLMISKHCHNCSEYIYILQHYKLEKQSFETNKLTQSNSDDIYFKWENDVLKIVRYNGLNCLSEIKTVDLLIEQWNNILIFFDEITFNTNKENIKLNLLISKLWRSTRIIFNKYINSIFKFSINTILELEEYINNQLRDMKMKNESFKSSTLFKINNKDWDSDIKSLISNKIQNPDFFVEKFKEKYSKIQKKLEKNSMIIIQKQQPSDIMLKNLKDTYEENNILHFHTKLVKDAYNRLSKNIGKIILFFLTSKSNNLSNSDINIICYFIKIIKLIKFSYPLGVDLNFFCNYYLKKLYKTLSLYIFLNKNVGKRLEIEIKNVISTKKLKILWENNQDFSPNHPSSEIVAIIQDIGLHIMTIGSDIFDRNAILILQCCFIDIIYSILENTFSTKISKDDYYKKYKDYKDNSNNLYHNIQNSQSTYIAITNQLQLYFDIKYLLMLFGNIDFKNKKLENINYIINYNTNDIIEKHETIKEFVIKYIEKTKTWFACRLWFLYSLAKNYKIQHKITIQKQINSYFHLYLQNKKNRHDTKKDSISLYSHIPTSTKILSTKSKNNSKFSMHQFDTYNLVSTLETTGFTHNQAVAVMRSIHALLINNLETAKTKFISRSNLENETHLFHASQSELKTEIQSMKKNEASTLRAETSALRKQLEILEQTLKEDLIALKNDVAIDVNDRKSSNKAEEKNIEIKIQELNNKFTIILGEIRAMLEKSKWDAARYGMFAIFIIAGFALIVVSMRETIQKKIQLIKPNQVSNKTHNEYQKKTIQKKIQLIKPNQVSNKTHNEPNSQTSEKILDNYALDIISLG
ncbi:hypothetical protein PORY_002374 [Pneumocystis oryctolagi]|uniref:Uncharacterized protein n=1 Tax=Pneumocystis oryctolagi TaxID=42067 RepID=A0ACB7CB98_9ASCO|nr:hypothetical protein PORY_002374 [Pneumocystis oryctolagi]